VAFLDPGETLPFLHTVHRAKVVWKVMFRGVVGEANLVGGGQGPGAGAGGGGGGRQGFLAPGSYYSTALCTIPTPQGLRPRRIACPPSRQVIKYNTTERDALDGARPKNGEISLRIRWARGPRAGARGKWARALCCRSRLHPPPRHSHLRTWQNPPRREAAGEAEEQQIVAALHAVAETAKVGAAAPLHACRRRRAPLPPACSRGAARSFRADPLAQGAAPLPPTAARPQAFRAAGWDEKTGPWPGPSDGALAALRAALARALARLGWGGLLGRAPPAGVGERGGGGED
jgi:hypothetical protein